MKVVVLVVLLAVTLCAGAFMYRPTTNAQTPDVQALISGVDAQRLRAHVDAIDEPRNVFEQPQRLIEAGSYVRSQFESLGYEVSTEDVADFGVTSENIYTELEGTSCAERIFIVGAHYDSVAEGPGADDNASGVAAMLEISRLLESTPLPATVRFAAFTMEEDGLIGSRAMAANLAAQRAEVVGMMSFDMVGFTAGEGNFLVTLANTASVLQTDAVHRAATYVPELPVVVINVEGNGDGLPDSRRSDHAPFWDAGYQGMIVTDTANLRNPNYHMASDTIDTLDFEFMANSTKAMLATTVDYLTYDGDNDGEADVCSGPLAATPTPTPTSTGLGAGETPGPTPNTTAAAAPGLPPTGLSQGERGRWPSIWLIVATVVGGLGVTSLVLQQRR